MADARPSHRLFGWTDTEAPILVTLHDDGGHERTLLSLVRAVWPGAAVLGLRGAVADGRGWRFLDGQAADTTRLDHLCECVISVLASKRARLRDVIALGVGGGATALASLLGRGPQPFVAAVLLHPSAPPVCLCPQGSGLRGMEVLIVAASGGIEAAQHAHAGITANGGAVFTYMSKRNEADDATIVRTWLQARLGGGVEDA